jgi:hypothetical protein
VKALLLALQAFEPLVERRQQRRRFGQFSIGEQVWDLPRIILCCCHLA